MPKYLSREEADSRIAEGDMEVINGLLSGEVKIGEAPEGEEQPVEEVVSETPVQEEVIVDQPPVEQIVNTPTEEVAPEVDEKQAIIDRYLEEAKKREDEANKAAAEAQLAREAREKINALKQPVVSEASTLKFDMPDIKEDDVAADLAGEFSRNNRTILNSLKDSVSSAASVDQVSALEAKLNALLQLEEDRKKKEEALAAERAQQERMNKLFTEVDAFSNKHSDTFGLNRSASDVYRDTLSFKDQVKKYLGTEDDLQVEAAYRRAVSGKDEELVKGLTNAGIRVPSDAENYLKLAEVVDLKNGYKFNDYTGQYEPIVNDFGDRVTLRSIDDAYKLSRFNDIVNQAKAEQVKEIEKRLSARSNSATVLPDSNTSNGDDAGLSLEEKQRILSLPNSAFKNNPELMKKLNTILGH